jgi:hypothetical protein
VFKERVSSLLSEYFSHHGDVLEFVNSLTESCVSREQQQRRRKKKTNATMNTNNNNSSDDAFILEVGEMVGRKSDSFELRPRDEGTGDVREIDGTVSLRCVLREGWSRGGEGGDEDEESFNIVVIICQSNTRTESRGGGVCVV